MTLATSAQMFPDGALYDPVGAGEMNDEGDRWCPIGDEPGDHWAHTNDTIHAVGRIMHRPNGWNG